ncbi:hypothetical protein C0J52_08045 [Blattella germanica]|nr:hypothetical protein C0J52_08045 [Blattella germanica]
MAAINRTLTLLFLFIMLFKSLDTSAPSVSALYVTMFSITCASAGIMYDPHSRGLTEEISIKQGKLVGVKVEFKSSSHLKPVEMYLGIPYAAAPTGSQRFMPPGSPPQWLDVKYATRHQAVCPQNLPDINEERRKSTMSEGRVNYLKRLLPYLQDNQSEDCLYLNIYAPAQKRVYGILWMEKQHVVLAESQSILFEFHAQNELKDEV